MSLWSKNLPSRSNNVVSLQKELNDFFSAAMGEPFMAMNLPEMKFSPSVNVKEDEKTYYVSAEIPGMKEEDIHVTLKDNALIIEGEKKIENKSENKGYLRTEISYGSFYRTIPFHAEVNPEKVSALYSNGVLDVAIEKSDIHATKTRKITVKKA